MVSIHVYGLSGSLVAKIWDGPLHAGKNEIAFAAGGSHGTYLVRVKEGESSSSYRLIAGFQGMRLLPDNRTAFHGGSLAKTAANVDWLQAAKTGYASHVEQIGSYTGTYDITLAPSTAPDFGANVFVFDPATDMAALQSKLSATFKQNESAQFGSNHFAYLFKPGKYSLDVNVPFYTEALGLGQSPDDVDITGQVHSEADWMGGNATCTFWRSVANMAVTPASGNTNRWAVSQGAPFRRMHVKGNLVLDDGGWASGGYIADSKIDGSVNSGSQQQWFSCNSDWGSWGGGGWNMVFVGIAKPPMGVWPNPPYTVIKKTPYIREKPFLTLDKAGNYSVLVPALMADSAIGTSWSTGSTPGTQIPIDQFYIAHAGKDNAASINAALAQGLNLLVTPGVYHLEASIRVSRPNTVVLGLPSFAPDKGVPALVTSDVGGIKIAGFIFEATTVNVPTLLQIGDSGSTADHASNPASLHDIFCRADHGAGAGWNSNKTNNGLVVNGNNVTVYGLFVEHCQQYQTLWNGNGGRTYFYQSEMPYDPPNQAGWVHAAVKGYASYKVSEGVTSHEAWGFCLYGVKHHLMGWINSIFPIASNPSIPDSSPPTI